MRRYMPVIPLVLVNGAEGIGTGWSTFIPNHDPAEVCANIRALLAGQPVSPMRPWYRGFKGPVTQVPSKTSGSTYTLNGVLNQVQPVLCCCACCCCCSCPAISSQHAECCSGTLSPSIF